MLAGIAQCCTWWQSALYGAPVGGGGNWPGGSGGSGRHGGHHGGGTMLYDAVFLASDELMQKQEGRKALVLLSDGKESLDSAIESAQRPNTVVYSILFKDDEAYYGDGGGYNRPSIGFPGGSRPGGGRAGRGGTHDGQPYPEHHPDGKKVLERISKETGGRLFEVSKKEPIDQIYSQIDEELRNQYSLGYTPDRASADDSSYHKIQVSAKASATFMRLTQALIASAWALPRVLKVLFMRDHPRFAFTTTAASGHTGALACLLDSDSGSEAVSLLYPYAKSCCRLQHRGPRAVDLACRIVLALLEFCLSSAAAYLGRCCRKNSAAVQA